MRINLKATAAAFFAVIAIGTISTPVSAQQQQPRFGIFTAFGGPVGAAALAGPATSTFGWATTHTFTKKIPYFKKVKFAHKWKYVKKYKTVSHNKTKYHSRSSKSINGKVVVGCIFGSALGAITASVRKASAMGNPPRWRSQAEHERIVASGIERQYELTNDEAHTAVALCGLGSLTLYWQQNP